VNQDGPIPDPEGWIRIAAPTSRYEDPSTLAFSLMILGIVGIYAGIRGMVIDRHVLIPLVGILAGTASGFAGLVSYRRLRAAGCRIEPDGLRVRNVFAEIVVPWERIEGFRLGQGVWGSMLVDCADGSTLAMTGIRAHVGDPGGRQIMDRLTGELIRRRRATDWDWSPPQLRRMPGRARHEQVRPGFVVALVVVVVVCLGPFVIGIAVEAGRENILGAATVCLGLFVAPAVALVRLRRRKAPVAFITLSLTCLFAPAAIVDAGALALPGSATVAVTAAVALAGLAVAFRLQAPPPPNDQ
jgi:hypothetical protein